jgi:hypothetical protein
MLEQPDALPSGVGAAHDEKTYDLVVIGAGIAGLNALNSALQYLPSGARALLLDQKVAPGGMWTVVYDYLRLHQPHPMFTVGDMRWDWSKPPHHLAARDEVQRHLERCLHRIGANLNLTQHFGHTVTSCTEVLTSNGPQAQVSFHPNGDPDNIETVFADQVIEAEGLNFRSPEPLALSARTVFSIAPDALRVTLAQNPDAPVFVIGGGKTGMDTIIEVLDRESGRQINIIVGKGTDFLNRTEYFPLGLERWRRGRPSSRIFREQATFFDGDNEAAAATHFRANYATSRDSRNQQFFYGMLSEEELGRIKGGVTDYRYDYLEDVVDTTEGPVMILRSGDAVSIPEGSIVVNCTGNIFRPGDAMQAKPCLSTHGKILSINVRDSIHFLSSVGGFFLPHLHYRGLLKDQGFYTIDLEALFRKDRTVWTAATATLAYLTQALVVKTLPLKVLDRCGLDLDRWYPFPRRLAALVQMKASSSRDIPHCQKVLDRVAERFDVHCGPLTPSDRSDGG